MKPRLLTIIWPFVLWSSLLCVSLWVRPLLPIDETRYTAVAWEMWHSGDYLVPHLNGEIYSHKPPLLFWLMTISWKFFGLNDWSHRFISPLFALAILYMSRNFARHLWPDRKSLPDLVPLFLSGSLLWSLYSTLTMFDMMLAFFVLAGAQILFKLASQGKSWKLWAMLGVVFGGGILSKGPVMLLHLLPLAILTPWWSTQNTAASWRHWYAGLSISVLLGAVFALCWALPAGIVGGEDYRNAIFLGQSSGRLIKSFAHASPWWWYLQILPLLLLPWLLFPPMWRGIQQLSIKDTGVRFCIFWIIPVLVVFSLISGKRIHYLLPLIPPMALLLAKAIDAISESRGLARAHSLVAGLFVGLGVVLAALPLLNGRYQWLQEVAGLSPIWGLLLATISAAIGWFKAEDVRQSALLVCMASVCALMILSAGLFSIKYRHFDTQETALKISELLQENKAVAYYTAKYHGQYQFTGRLTQPLSILTNSNQLYDWAKLHPNGFIIVEYRNSNPLPDSIFSERFPIKSHHGGFLSSKEILANPAIRFQIVL